MNAIILSVGDELVLGQTVDTNSAWLSRQLAAVGCAVVGHLTVGDDQSAIELAIRESSGRCDLLLITGGIGPTEDDMTRQALAAVMGVPLESSEVWLDRLKDFFERRGRMMPESNKIQAMIPRRARMIENTAGTAAGIHATIGGPARPPMPPVSELQNRPIGRILTKMGKVTREQVVEALTFQKSKGGLLGRILVDLGYATAQDVQLALAAQKGVDLPAFTPRIADAACEVFVMPGVPKEMKIMFERDVLPHVRHNADGAVILSRTLHTFGLGESTVAEKLGELMKRDRNPSVGTTVAQGIVSLRVNARFPSRADAEARLAETVAACQAALGDLIYGTEEETLAEVVGRMLAGGSADRPASTLTTAESCTGGLLAKLITDVPGSSAYFKNGFVTYSNDAKHERLGVSRELIGLYGAVSEPVARAMAVNARRLAKAKFALAITGVAGPEGGTPAKPVGMVCIALAFPSAGARPSDYAASDLVVRTFNFPGDREMVRDRSAKMALATLRYHLLGKPMPF